MRDLWQKTFTICLCFISVDLSVAHIVCRNCDQYQICGIKTSDMPDCPNGLPCTKKQYSFCTKITIANRKKKCDRPGMFMDFESPDKFYTCKFKKNNLTFQKKIMKCRQNTTFDSVTMRCLTENEKTVLKTAKDLTSVYRDKEPKFNCKKTGIFSDPYDCKVYHVCNSKLQSQDFYCPLGTYFNRRNCYTTKTKKCIKQLRKQYFNKISQGKDIYKHLKYLVHKNSPTYPKSHNSSLLIAPGVIKKTVCDSSQNRYTYYGIKTNSKHTNYSDSEIKKFEQFVETVIAQSQKEKNDTLVLSELKTATENQTDIAIHTKVLFTTPSGQKLRKKINKSCPSVKKKIKLEKVTVIHITQNNCEIKKNSFGTTKVYATGIYDSKAVTSPTKKLTNNYTYSVTPVPSDISISFTKANTNENLKFSTSTGKKKTSLTNEHLVTSAIEPEAIILSAINNSSDNIHSSSPGTEKTTSSIPDQPLTSIIEAENVTFMTTSDNIQSPISSAKKITTTSTHEQPLISVIEPEGITTLLPNNFIDNTYSTTSTTEKTVSPTHEQPVTSIIEPEGTTTLLSNNFVNNIYSTTSTTEKTVTPTHEQPVTSITEPEGTTTLLSNNFVDNIYSTTSTTEKTVTPTHEQPVTSITEPEGTTTLLSNNFVDNIYSTTSTTEKTVTPTHEQPVTSITEPEETTTLLSNNFIDNTYSTTSTTEKTVSPTHEQPVTYIIEPEGTTILTLNNSTDGFHSSTPFTEKITTSATHEQSVTESEVITLLTTNNSTDDIHSTTPAIEKMTSILDQPLTSVIEAENETFMTTSDNIQSTISSAKKITTTSTHEQPVTSVKEAEVITLLTINNFTDDSHFTTSATEKTTYGTSGQPIGPESIGENNNTKNFDSSTSSVKEKTTSTHYHPTTSTVLEAESITDIIKDNTNINFKSTTSPPTHHQPVTSIIELEATIALEELNNTKSFEFSTPPTKKNTTPLNNDHSITFLREAEDTTVSVTNISTESTDNIHSTLSAKEKITYTTQGQPKTSNDVVLTTNNVTENLKFTVSPVKEKSPPTISNCSKGPVLEQETTVSSNISGITLYSSTFHSEMITSSGSKKITQVPNINTSPYLSDKESTNQTSYSDVTVLSNTKTNPIIMNTVQHLDTTTHLLSTATISLNQNLFNSETSSTIIPSHKSTYSTQHLLKITSDHSKLPISPTKINSDNDSSNLNIFSSNSNNIQTKQSTADYSKKTKAPQGMAAFYSTLSTTRNSFNKISTVKSSTPSFAPSSFSTNKHLTGKNPKKPAFKPFRCKREGLFKDPNDCSKYYQCKKIRIASNRCFHCKPKRWKFEIIHHKCKKGKWFSSFFGICHKIKPANC